MSPVAPSPMNVTTRMAGTTANSRVMIRRNQGAIRRCRYPSITIWPESVAVTVEFKPVPAGGKVDADCFRDMEGIAWRGRITPMSAAIRNGREKIHTLQAAVDAIGRFAGTTS